MNCVVSVSSLNWTTWISRNMAGLATVEASSVSHIILPFLLRRSRTDTRIIPIFSFSRSFAFTFRRSILPFTFATSASSRSFPGIIIVTSTTSASGVPGITVVVFTVTSSAVARIYGSCASTAGKRQLPKISLADTSNHVLGVVLCKYLHSDYARDITRSSEAKLHYCA